MEDAVKPPRPLYTNGSPRADNPQWYWVKWAEQGHVWRIWRYEDIAKRLRNATRKLYEMRMS